MTTRHIVQQGECMASIADRHGFSLRTLWDHPANAALRRLRGDPYALYPGDVVEIPARRPGEATCATDRVHRFRRRGVPERYRLQIFDDGVPRAGAPYLFEIGDELRERTTDAEGWVIEWIPPQARHARLTLLSPTPPDAPGDDEDEDAFADETDSPISLEVYEIDLGALDPADTPSGGAARLRALGYLESGDDPDRLTVALYTFQLDEDLPPTGELDAPTSARLRELHGS